MRCCVCLASPEDELTIENDVPGVGSIQVPICFVCADRFRRRKILAYSLLVSCILFFGAGVGLGSVDKVKAALGGAAFGLMIGIFISYVIVFTSQPVQVTSTGIRFKNPEYQELFEKINRKGRSSAPVDAGPEKVKRDSRASAIRKSPVEPLTQEERELLYYIGMKLKLTYPNTNLNNLTGEVRVEYSLNEDTAKWYVSHSVEAMKEAGEISD